MSPATTSSIHQSAASTPRASIAIRDIATFCWVGFIVFLVMPILYLLYGAVQRGEFLRKNPERDFIYFYAMGKTLNEQPAAKLYDYEFQKKMASDIHALKNRQYGPNPYPPFVAVFFRPFALLPFTHAYLLWLSLSFCLYFTSLRRIAREFFPDDGARRSLVYCLGLSYLPFLWIMIGGQIPSIGLFGLSLAICEENRRRPVRSGLSLALCLCKPTFLVLLLPMLVVSRRYRTIAGFCLGALGLILFATVIAGTQVWAGYYHLLVSFGTAAAHAHGYKDLPNYMDLSSFSSMLPGGRSVFGLALLSVGALWAGVSLLRAWWKSRYTTGQRRGLMIWAATVSWTLVLNLYVPVYDSILAVPGVVATAMVLRELHSRGLQRWFTVAWVVTFAASWITLGLARSYGFQLLTVCFTILAMLQTAAFRNSVEYPKAAGQNL